jgi:hypothetical protein
MKKLPLAALVCGSALLGMAAGVLVGRSRGIPFVAQGEHWSIGIYKGESPFEMTSSFWSFNPVLSAFDVTDVAASFVADPFLHRDGDTWYLFFEVYNLRTGQGDISVATGDGGRKWDYQRVVLDEPFHLSYPYVFEWEGGHYMIPETFETASIRLYRASDFPSGWELVATLVEGRDYVDPSVAFFGNRWWMFAATTTNDTLHLFWADRLEGPWNAHARSPIVEGDAHRSRPSGRVLVDDGRIYRYTMDVNPPVGTHRVMAYEITTLSPSEYEERLVGDRPILEPHGSGWTQQAMHQIDPHRLEDGSWLASVDGFGKFREYGWAH